jgi:hypothetical protein
VTGAVYVPAPSGSKPRRPLLAITVEIGGTPILFETSDPDFRTMIENRYAGFLNTSAAPAYRFKIHLASSVEPSEKDVQISRRGSVWLLERGDFQADWDPQSCVGRVFQSPNPYSLDTVLRVVHSLVLAEQGGFLVHAASALRTGRGFLFAGVSGAGKTTLARLAPPDATVLTDEISYVRRTGNGYRAYGTPFAGELARVGENVSAPLSGLYLLEKGQENRIEPLEPLAAARTLMRHILFFAHDEGMVKKVFDSVMTFVSCVRVARLVFTPDERVWGLIG